MEVYVKIWKDDDMLGFLKFDDEESLTENTEFLDTMFDYGFRIEKTTEQEYIDFDGGDELSVDDIKKGNYRIEDNID